MSPKTKQKVRRFLEAWITAVEVKRKEEGGGKYFRNGHLSFITLTLPATQQHSDNQIKRSMLNHFITTIKRQYGVSNYFWRAEAQKNKNIHFHILIDKFIPHDQVRNIWNNCLVPFGYIDAFEAMHGHRNPNSTDIKGLEKVKNCTSYVVKYCCKTDGYRTINGRIWGCSDSLKVVRSYETEVTAKVSEFLQQCGRQKGVRKEVKEDFTLMFLDTEYYLKRLAPLLYNEYKSHHLKNYHDLYISQPAPPTTERPVRVCKYIEEKKAVYVQARMSFESCSN